MASLRIPLSRPSEIVVIDNLPEPLDDEPTWPGRALPREARRVFPPPWAGGRRPPWAAVLPEPEPVAPRGTSPGLFQPNPIPTDLADAEAAAPVLEDEPSPVAPDPAVALDTDVDPTAVMLVPPPTPPAGMVLVPAREIRFSTRVFTVEPHFLDRNLVTRGDWEAYLRATGLPAPEGWRGGKPPAGTENHPVTGVTWDEALAYAAWRGARLPTVAEWLAAAAGLTWFPPRPDLCQGLCHCPRSGRFEGTAPVGAYPNSNSVDGCADLLGNVWEWAAPDERLPPPDADHSWALGGSFKHACPATASTWGNRVPQTMIHHAKSWPHLGFRCARSLP